VIELGFYNYKVGKTMLDKEDLIQFTLKVIIVCTAIIITWGIIDSLGLEIGINQNM
jgi:hypothetical protein